MRANEILIDLSRQKHPVDIGEKASNLHWLLKKGYKVPRTYVLPFPVYDAYLSNSHTLLEKITTILSKTLAASRSYAVRSSANLEDTTQHSFAGQFCTFLEIQGTEKVLQAVVDVWQSAHSNKVQVYADESGQNLGRLKLAVIIQEMVKPVVSGIAFSHNPLTGLNEVIIEALTGSGEQLVQEGKTPERWVNKWGLWTEKPEKSEFEGGLIHEVVTATSIIAKEYGSPVDLEWVYDGENLYWVQLRPITQLMGIKIYSNRISREVFPGLIKPLIWSVNVPLVNTVWINLFTEIIGPNDLKPEDLAKSFWYRAYFNMGTIGRILELMGFPRESLELLLGLNGGNEKPGFKPSGKTMRLLPRMISFMLGKLLIGNQVMPSLNEIRQDYDRVLSEPPHTFDEAGLMRQIDRLYTITQKVAYYNVSVPLLMNIYNALLRRLLGRNGIDFTRFDVTYGLEELEDYDPHLHIRRAAEDYNTLDTQVQAKICSASYDEFIAMEGVQDFQNRVAGIITRFGHLSDSGNDFSAIPWQETPDLVLKLVLVEAQRLREYKEPAMSHGKPISVVAQSDGIVQLGTKINWESIKVNPFQRLTIRPIYFQARQFRLYREAVSSMYTYGYGLFRTYFMDLGRRLVEDGIIEQAEDIFYLSWNEIRATVNDLPGCASLAGLVSQRKTELQLSQLMKLPEIIYGDELPPVLDAGQTINKYKGFPSSRGFYRGPAKVIRSVADFNKLDPGDVLVIPFSDVSWTPLFTRAGAVIAESGGILSHSSIVAREYNLPCVVSVAQACQIPDSTIVTVDGYTGEVLIHGSYDS